MATTIKRITLALSKEDLRILEDLKKELGESSSQVIKLSLKVAHLMRVDLKAKLVPMT